MYLQLVEKIAATYNYNISIKHLFFLLLIIIKMH